MGFISALQWAIKLPTHFSSNHCMHIILLLYYCCCWRTSALLFSYQGFCCQAKTKERAYLYNDNKLNSSRKEWALTVTYLIGHNATETIISVVKNEVSFKMTVTSIQFNPMANEQIWIWIYTATTTIVFVIIPESSSLFARRSTIFA